MVHFESSTIWIRSPRSFNTSCFFNSIVIITLFSSSLKNSFLYLTSSYASDLSLNYVNRLSYSFFNLWYFKTVFFSRLSISRTCFSSSRTLFFSVDSWVGISVNIVCIGIVGGGGALGGEIAFLGLNWFPWVLAVSVFFYNSIFFLSDPFDS